MFTDITPHRFRAIKPNGVGGLHLYNPETFQTFDDKDMRHNLAETLYR